MVYESRLELARIMLADQDPDVTAIAAQPFQLTGPDQERVRRHVPDLLRVYDGELWEVVELDGARAVLRSDRSTQVRAVQISTLVTGARPADNQPAAGEQSPTLVLSGLTDVPRAVVAERAGHVREVLTGYRAGYPDGAAAGEPRPEYAGVPLRARYRARARELDVGVRTVVRW